jgi:hydroxypyruvate isomerase
LRGWSACIEWLFADVAEDLPGRIRAARAAGFTAVEFWGPDGKDLVGIKAALDDTGLKLAGILTEPMSQLTDPATHAAFLEGVHHSLETAQRLGAGLMIVTTGDDRPEVARATQHGGLVDVLRKAAVLMEGSGIVLGLEPLNDRVDHAGYYLTSTVEGLDIVDEVGHPSLRLLYDIYHSAMMGERTEDVLDGRVDRVAHVHLADAPGRGEPGSGAVDLGSRLEWLHAHGYVGLVGLEYRPSKATAETLGFIQ